MTLAAEERELRVRCLDGRTIREAVAEYERVSGRKIAEQTMREWAEYNRIPYANAKQPWSGREARILRDHYQRDGVKKTMRALSDEGFERSEQAIIKQAMNFGLQRRRRC